MNSYPHCEVVIRDRSGMAWAGVIQSDNEEQARATALARLRRAGGLVKNGGPITVDSKLRTAPGQDSILG